MKAKWVSPSMMYRIIAAIIASLAWNYCFNGSWSGAVVCFFASLLISEAFDGKQRGFARLALGIFLINAGCFTYGLYGFTLAGVGVAAGFCVIIAMLIVQVRRQITNKQRAATN